MRSMVRRTSVSEERGSALITAMGVMLVAMALATIVVATAIVSTNDSSRERAQTFEVHSAEGVVDTLYAVLETETPCVWPATGSVSAGTSPAETKVTATIAYYDSNLNSLSCANGVVSGTPTSAVITATADSKRTGTGVDSARKVQAKVNLTPTTVNGRGAAIFAANSIMTTNGFTLNSVQPDADTDVWVDTGDVNCNSNVNIDGNLIVVSGKTDISGNCRVTKDLWSKKLLTVHQAQGAGLTTVGQDTYAAGGATLAGGSSYGRNVSVSGSYSTWGAGPVVGGVLKTGVAGSALPVYQAVGLPEVNYKPSDWVGFTISGDRQQAYRDWIRQNAVADGAPSWSAALVNSGTSQCSIAGDNWSLNGPLKSPGVPTLFDTRFCSQTMLQGNLNIKLYSDLVIFANDFYATGNFQITSGDGQPHKMWIIVPDPDVSPNGTADCGKTVGGYKSGNIKFDSGSLAVSPITFFGYTPCTLETNNTMTFYGQLYGKDVILRNNMTMRYDAIGIPGVNLPSTAPVAAAGYRVDVVYKREIG